ncbi:MAG: zinc dependent phospholipase C family protein [bacterium]
MNFSLGGTTLPFLIFTLAFVFHPDPSAAWGPGVHLYLGTRLLEAGVLTGAISTLLETKRTSFLYGNVIADIVVGKNMIDIEDHSHHWNVGRSLRKSASGDDEEAFALGYWTHLAADTVAHNLFVPNQQRKGFSSKRLGHAYWELQAENWLPDRYHEQVGDLLEEDFGKHQTLLQNAIPQTVLPFRFNWLIMEGVFHLSERRTPHNMAALIDRYADASLESQDMEDYMDLCEVRMEESLEGLENRITRLSPIGKGSRFLP